MVDPRFAGNAQRRRIGAPSSHMGMIDDENNDNIAARQYAQQGIKNKILDSPAAQSDSNGVGAETADFSQQLKDLDVTNDQQFSRPAKR